jgi:hypothetical protein
LCRGSFDAGGRCCNQSADGATGRREPTVTTSVPSAAELIHLGMDTSVNEILVAVLRPGEEISVVDLIPGDGESVRRLIGGFPDRRLLSGLL